MRWTAGITWHADPGGMTDTSLASEFCAGNNMIMMNCVIINEILSLDADRESLSKNHVLYYRLRGMRPADQGGYPGLPPILTHEMHEEFDSGKDVLPVGGMAEPC